MISVSAQLKAQRYHEAHVLLTFLLFAFAAAGLYGHYKLRAQYELEHALRPNLN
jgi:hypothetical protein